jgi:hypothetical protein
MSGSFTTRELEHALRRKGFYYDDRSGHRFLHLHVDGQPTGVKTMVSRSNYDVAGALRKQISSQLRMPDAAYLNRFVDCAVSLEDYLAHLRESGVL